LTLAAGAIVNNLKARLARLYDGRDRMSKRFLYGLLIFDLVSVAYFIVSTFFHTDVWIIAVDALIALVIIADLVSRFIISDRPLKLALHVATWVDVVVIASLLMPLVFESFLFLRVVRALRLLRSYHVVADLRGASRFVARNEDVIESVINLTVFVFSMTALVYVLQVRINPAISNYVDALYFTVTTLTTTGFGDITPVGESGRVLAIAIMVFGVALFLRLVQTIFRPQKVQFECPDCGLMRHDADAVHCKHCGRVLHIAAEGD
jgi:voltage-gated potassium channel